MATKQPPPPSPPRGSPQQPHHHQQPQQPQQPQQARRSVDSDSTVLAPRPDMTDDTGASLEELDSGMVFEDELEDLTTAGGKKKLMKPDLTVNAADVSLIEAQSEFFAGPAPSLEGFDSPRVTSANLGTNVLDPDSDGDDTNPPTEILRLALSDPGSDPVLDTTPAVVKKWRMGKVQLMDDDGEGDTPAPHASHSVAAGGAPITSGGRGAFQLPPTDQGQSGPTPLPPSPSPSLASPSSGTRVDAVPGAMGGKGGASLDVAELQRILEEAEKLMRTVKVQLGAMDLGESRGTNAQVAAALHRLGEALAMVRNR